MTTLPRLPVVLVVLTGLTVAVVVLGAGPVLQPLLVALFLMAGPGAAVLLPARSWPVLPWLTAVVSTSLALDVLVSTALLYLGWWSPAAVLGCLAALCLGCAGASLLRPARVP